MVVFRASPGQAGPLGATAEPGAVNFSLFSANAERVELCLFEDPHDTEVARLALNRTGDIWHIRVEGIGVGQRYGYRVHGPFEPREGHRFNANKLLIDPYAKALDRAFVLSDTHFAYKQDHPLLDLSFDDRDSAPYTPKGIVLADPDNPMKEYVARPWRQTVIYELHVRGMTMRREDLPRPLRGTLAGLASKPIINHLRQLGVTAIELLPIAAHADEPHLVRNGLRNYWGYNSVNFFALEPRYALSTLPAEFSACVRAFHNEGIEVILDVVYNHTAEGDARGPTFSFRGIDNASYYLLPPEDRSRYVNHSGTGNTLNMAHERVRALVLDSLRHWARLGADGFRFDLAAVLGRENGGFNPRAAFFVELRSDPVLSRLKLIAEPWDASPDGYCLGRFPDPFVEWNDRFRDGVRRFWRGDPGQIPEFAQRFTGSSDIMGNRWPLANVNYVTSHDGFTLADLVSYSRKHNLPNHENNADGPSESFSWNCGIEGQTTDASVRELRLRCRRNLIATVAFSLGVPMLAMGDELGRSQQGNNNAYCQDNEISWLDWTGSGKENQVFLHFVQRVLRLRAEHATFRRDAFFTGSEEGPRHLKDIAWLHPDGSEMQAEDWHDPSSRAFACTFGAGGDDARRYMLLFNADSQAVHFRLARSETPWRRLLDTAFGDGGSEYRQAGETDFIAEGRSLVLFQEDDRLIPTQAGPAA